MKVLLPLLVLSVSLPAQETVIKVDVDLVNVLCSVRNKGNGLVGNLEKNDFKVFEDGKEQEIKYFTRETDLPLTIGLLVDTSKSQENLIETEKRAAYQFFKQVLRKKDMAFLMQFGAEAELLQDDTNSPQLLQDGLNQLRLSVPMGGLHPGPVPTQQNMAGTILFDAIYLAATEKLKGEVGRKVMVVITDGDDTGSRTRIDKAIEAAQKSDSIIYFIDYEDPRYHGGFGAISMGGGGSDMKKMSSETGGRVFRVDRKNSLEEIFKDLQDEMRSQYAIGYTSPKSSKDGSYHKLDIRVANKDYKVQARKGYYAIPAEN
ncbi:MAG TPA: VWA domain-containing protein [Bryobacteraceae bacterium]|nr:VWA domain-containing protein [Bryobacteraceae bacterium]